MTLENLLQDIEYSHARGRMDRHVTDIAYDSRKAQTGGLFVCLAGQQSDGHDWASSAYERGARCFLCERVPDTLPENCTIVLTGNTRKALALISARWFGFPAKQLRLIGVTGTKGKSTVVSTLQQVLQSGGVPTGTIGTNGAFFAGQYRELVNTTPESYELHKIFREMADAGLKAAAIEVSSIAVKMYRTFGIPFELGIFTNISPDHIGSGEHGSFDDYLACKTAMFRQCQRGLMNADDEQLPYILSNSPLKLETFGVKNPADFSAENILLLQKEGFLGISFQCHTPQGVFPVELCQPGLFSAYNALAVIWAAQCFGFDAEAIHRGLMSARVAGRAELVDALPYCSVIIDYAHNELSMDSILRTLKAYRTGRLVVVFGSVGGRSQMRRAALGRVASELADFCVLTSDNPNHENPMDIINDIEAGMTRDIPRVKIPDREAAIEYAIAHAQQGDTILLAGKGHEKYQLIKGENVPFDERTIILRAAEARHEGVSTLPYFVPLFPPKLP
ncbi:MAG: UDP-N-acetylmuramoyl-L-alanyl-D-glutamate--2,6-diaminopimelate ligase [Oscillospiraceae bacterium]|nr:UDP-N-acetylmuramoyl-L-alanyl-D-glutamate--2,6-diaminopimelate ligase [Oscillospiraceae bacterium]